MAVAIHPDIRAMYEEVQKHLAEMKGLQQKKSKCVESRHQLESQKTENELVREELYHLEDGAGVYKLIGPVLVSQDASDAKMIVEKRLEYITGEMKRTDVTIDDFEKKEESERIKIIDLQRRMQERQNQIVAAQQRQ
ncbi:prefoldin-like protein, putative [Bodo saltans]|uniref:Prefoldin-like protein, putative n=1 Tax=Bodo saltans TaxID=75058 RepID=A0A0S4INB7_BODSA|nr:prefoldin-like protein, putative [Bodo saltans]|eukprot:CUF64151.1 prefoldin-like protein, putative [Bodo saltans]